MPRRPGANAFPEGSIYGSTRCTTSLGSQHPKRKFCAPQGLSLDISEAWGNLPPAPKIRIGVSGVMSASTALDLPFLWQVLDVLTP
jgi:hypothetical protein